MATAAYAVFDPYTTTVQYAAAGHLPPVVITPSGTRVIEVMPAPPLGAFPYGRCAEHEFALERGDILFFYTDGLVERRGIPLSDGIEALASSVAGAVSPEEACLAAVADLVPLEGLRDDVAIVALQNSPVPAELHLRLPAEPATLAQMRRILRRWLVEQGGGEADVAEVTIAVSEACANAIEHAYSPAPATFQLDAWGRTAASRSRCGTTASGASRGGRRIADGGSQSSPPRWITCRSTAGRPAPKS